MIGKNRVGVEAMANFQVKHITFTGDQLVGKLFALDKTTHNKGILADKTLDTPAVGFIAEGSPAKSWEAPSDIPNRPLYEGDGQNVYAVGILNLNTTADYFTDEEVATRIPIYEGTAGAWTKVKPTTTGDRVRVIGFPIQKNKIWVDFTLEPVGTVI